MKHHNKNRKFGRERKVRTALMRSLLSALITHGSIRTTEAKAKEIRPLIEKMMTQAKKGSIAARRLLAARLQSKEAAAKLMTAIAPRHVKRTGGYTRITKLPPRKSDGSTMAIIAFVDVA